MAREMTGRAAVAVVAAAEVDRSDHLAGVGDRVVCHAVENRSEGPRGSTDDAAVDQRQRFGAVCDVADSIVAFNDASIDDGGTEGAIGAPHQYRCPAEGRDNAIVFEMVIYARHSDCSVAPERLHTAARLDVHRLTTE